MEVGFFNTLAVIALRVGQAIKSLLEIGTSICQSLKLWNRVDRGLYGLLPIPECESNVLKAMCITDTGNAIFAPSVGAGAGVFVGEVWWPRTHALVLLQSQLDS